MYWAFNAWYGIGGRKMPEYTQEQIDAMIAEAKKGLYTKDELEREITRETDRRVESGIKKGIETQKEKWEREFRERAELSAEELAKKQLAEREKELANREKSIAINANRLNARKALIDAGVPESYYGKLIDNLVSADADKTTTNIQTMVETYNSIKADIETSVRSELSEVPSPPGGTGGNGEVTKEVFDKMTSAQKIEFKQKEPELFRELIK